MYEGYNMPTEDDGYWSSPDYGAALEAQRAGVNQAQAQGAPGSAGMDAAGSGAMASGNPYAMGAGFALKAYAAQKDRQQKAMLANYESALAKTQERMKAAAAGMQMVDRMGLT